jgi:hypothetical protein
MDRSRITINEADEEDMQEMADDLPVCPFKQRRNWHFGAHVDCECEQRKLLIKEFNHWLENKKPKQRADEERQRNQGE